MLGAVLVTDAAGFFGSFLCGRLVEDGGWEAAGLDNVNSCYDLGITEGRLRTLREADVDRCFIFVNGDRADAALVERLFFENGFDVVVNLAAQTGVRYSIDNAKVYIDSNLVELYNVLEVSAHYTVRRLVFASSSSVYGGNERVSFSEADQVDRPASPCADCSVLERDFGYRPMTGLEDGLRAFTWWYRGYYGVC